MIYGKIKNVPNHQPVLECAWSLETESQEDCCDNCWIRSLKFSAQAAPLLKKKKKRKCKGNQLTEPLM